jgi:lipopolysaccharide transport system permease protein
MAARSELVAPAAPTAGATGPGTRTAVHHRLAPAGRWPGVDVHELWAARGLLGFLVWRDVKVRYAQTVLGAGWAVLQPVLAMVVFTVIFGRFARIPSDGVPYPAFSLTALVPWTYFSTALAGASNSLLLSTSLLTKVYFPRLSIPLAPVVAALLDFAIALTVLLLVLSGYHIVPSAWALLVVPLLLLVAVMTVAGVGCLLAALNVQYRDVKYVTPFLVQVWMYASPIVYPLSLVPREYHVVYALNPMVGVIAGFRAVLLGRDPIPWPVIVPGALTSVVLLVLGVLYFQHTERVFADVA